MLIFYFYLELNGHQHLLVVGLLRNRSRMKDHIRHKGKSPMLRPINSTRCWKFGGENAKIQHYNGFAMPLHADGHESSDSK